MPIKPFLNLLPDDWQSDVDVAILNACNILSLCDDSSIGWGDTLGWGNTVGYDPRCKVSHGDTHQGYHPDHPPTDLNCLVCSDLDYASGYSTSKRGDR